MSEGEGRSPGRPLTHGTLAPALRTDPAPLARTPRFPTGLSLPRRAVLGDGERSHPELRGSPHRPHPLRSPPRGARRRRSPSAGRHGAAQQRRRPRRRGPLSIFPLGRPGRRVRGAVGTFATLLAFHSRHVTPRRPRHSTPLPAHSSGGRGFQGGKGRAGLARPQGPRRRGRLPSARRPSRGARP